jgi:hypothetical protein
LKGLRGGGGGRERRDGSTCVKVTNFVGEEFEHTHSDEELKSGDRESFEDGGADSHQFAERGKLGRELGVRGGGFGVVD